MELEAAQNAVRLRCREGLVESILRMGRQIVGHDADQFRLWIVKVDEIAHAFGEVARPVPVGDPDHALGLIDTKEDEQVGRAVGWHAQ